MNKIIGYVIVLDSRPVRHQDDSPYWLQFSGYCELYKTYKAALSDFRKEMRAINREEKAAGVPIKLLRRWKESLRIIQVRAAQP